jgi:hypothetical protein
MEKVSGARFQVAVGPGLPACHFPLPFATYHSLTPVPGNLN